MQLSNQQQSYNENLFVVRLLLLTILFSVGSITMNAQSQATATPNYAEDPAWIKMMEDPNVNYYEAIKAYNEYWKNHSLPKGEEEEMSEENSDNKERQRELKREIRKDQSRKLTEEDLKKQNELVVMKFQVKRFQQWTREVKPFVQEDGSILSDKERMDIWTKQQEEIIKQQK